MILYGCGQSMLTYYDRDTALGHPSPFSLRSLCWSDEKILLKFKYGHGWPSDSVLVLAFPLAFACWKGWRLSLHVVSTIEPSPICSFPFVRKATSNDQHFLEIRIVSEYLWPQSRSINQGFFDRLLAWVELEPTNICNLPSCLLLNFPFYFLSGILSPGKMVGIGINSHPIHYWLNIMISCICITQNDDADSTHFGVQHPISTQSGA